MPNNFTSSTFATTYKDDYRDSDNYYRILFNSGRALQARELTQMQTIIQNEIARFGRNIFLEGALVNPGGITINNKYEYIKLDVSSNPLPNDPTDLIGLELTVKAPNPAIKVKVLDFIPASGSDPETIYVRYTDTSAGAAGATSVRVIDGSLLSNPAINDIKAAASNATGVGTTASVQNGDFFTQGHFVYAPDQTVFISKYSGTPTVELGFKVTQDIITINDTADLYDNQGALPNVAAPGADRYRIRLLLTTKDQISTGENFVYLAQLTNGVITDQVTGKESYNLINDLLALRTKEESGDYVVREFRAKFDNIENNDSNLSLDVSGGTAYVDGYRLNIPPTKITVPKARDTITEDNQFVIAQYGNYVLGNPSNNSGLPDISTFVEVNLKDTVNYGGNTIGTARVRAIEEDGAFFKYYLFDIKMNPNQNFRNTRSFGASGTDYTNILLEDGIAQLRSTSNNSLLFPLPRSKPSTSGVSIDTLVVQKRYTFTASGSTYNLAAGGGDIFTNTGDWILAKATGTIDASASAGFTLAGSPVGSSVNITGITAGNYILVAYVALDNPVIRTKTLNTGSTLTKAWPADADSDGNGLQFLSLETADIYKVTRIRTEDSDGIDLTSNFIVDNGQRDNFYALGRLIPRGGTTIPSTDIYVKFDHFTHNAGDLFAVNSYNGVVPYENIPSYRKNNGEVISLRDVLDFRPVQNSSENYVGGDAEINLIPQNTDVITATIEYYMPRKDRLVVTTRDSKSRAGRGRLQVVQGASSLTPQYPSIPTGSLALYDLELNAYTVDDSDVSTFFIPNKRYTMRDIGRIENRVDELTELTTLSLLEANTTLLTVLDSNGLERTKAGFLADNFSNFAFSDISKSEYRASIDLSENVLVPKFNAKNIRLFYDSNDGNNSVTRKGDYLILPYSDTSLVYQNLATETINVNPFAVITATGFMELSPASDEWVETRRAADLVVSGGTITNNVGSVRTNRWVVNSWFGNSQTVGTTNRGDGGVRVITGVRTIREQIGERVIDVQFIPFMRSRKVFFRAQGLRPNTRFFAFFADTPVSDWCRSETSFQRFSSRSGDVGNVHANATSHPDGSSALFSNDEGEVIGSFFIPNTSSIRFRTGQQEFKLLDISVNDDANAINSASTLYTSTGIIETVQRTVRSTRIQNVTEFWFREEQDNGGGDADPLAQSFRIDQGENPSGLFISKVRLFFSTKEASGGAPVQVQIRTVENGIPTSSVVPGANKSLSPDDVNIPGDLDNLTSVRSAFTDFVFDEPVYLTPGEEYAIVILTQSVAYNVYVAKTYEFLLGSTEARVNKQPTLGSLFISQNARTWTPDQTRDLMFELYRAEFNSSATAYLENGPTPLELLEANPFLTDSGDSAVTVFHENHGFVKGDTVYLSGIPSAGIGGIPQNAITGSRNILEVDWTGYKIGAAAGNTANATLRAGGDGVVVSQQMMFDEFIPYVERLVPQNTSIESTIKLTSGASYASNRNLASNTAYAKASNFSSVVLNQINTNTQPKLIASDSNETAQLSGQKSLTLKIDLSTSDTKVSPILDLQRASITGIENIIDKQDSASVSDFNIPLSFVNETHPTDGSHAAKHITRQVTLEEAAVGLKILFAANRPAVSDFIVYYKAGTSDEVLDDKNWELVNKEASVPADDNPDIFREYEYLAGGVNGTLTPFSKFQIKIVFTTTNTSQVPRIRDLRAIALAV